MIDDGKITMFSNALIEWLKGKYSLDLNTTQLLSILIINIFVWINHNFDNQNIKYLLSLCLNYKSKEMPWD
jgi:hypothetical protein